MAWADVPTKIDTLEAKEYYTPGYVERLVRAYTNGTSDDIADVPEHRRTDFEADIDYVSGACDNLANAKAVRP